MRLLLDNLPASLQLQREALKQCLEAFNRARHVRAVYLFGSHARGEAQRDSDVDLCIVADGADRQCEAARDFRDELWGIWPRPSLTLIPISPRRLEEKKACGDHFFQTILQEGVLLATEN
ncbi:MAG: nucleotidyltransferase domain-containing protein [Verrucomicrobia bacterium]|nr:nucleotidyltransferase domain-containing protein [Verrucomicrobiota bacterium]